MVLSGLLRLEICTMARNYNLLKKIIRDAVNFYTDCDGRLRESRKNVGMCLVGTRTFHLQLLVVLDKYSKHLSLIIYS